MQAHDERPDVQRIDAEEFRALLVSRRSLERLQPYPRRDRRRENGLRDRRTGTVYVWSPGVDSTRAGAGPFVPAGGAR